jgi:hypothetical protein
MKVLINNSPPEREREKQQSWTRFPINLRFISNIKRKFPTPTKIFSFPPSVQISETHSTIRSLRYVNFANEDRAIPNYKQDMVKREKSKLQL